MFYSWVHELICLTYDNGQIIHRHNTDLLQTKQFTNIFKAMRRYYQDEKAEW